MMEIALKLDEDQSAAFAKVFADPVPRLIKPLALAWGSGAQEVLGRAVRGRFTGRGPFPVAEHKLGVDSHRLRKSLRATAPEMDNAGNIRVAMGSNVSYFHAHEFGFSGAVHVRGHTRRTVVGKTNSRGKLTKKSLEQMKANAARGRAGYVYVKPHGRKMRIPERRPLRTEIQALSSRVLLYSKLKAVVMRILRISKS